MRFLAALALTAIAPAQTYVALRLEPPGLVLTGPGASQRLVVTATDAAGIDRDVTRQARIQSANPALLTIDSSEVAAVAKAPGATVITAEFGTLSASQTVEIRSGGQEAAVRFSPDIVSILTVKGCNSSNCHGAIAGKNGFKLSLFGYDPTADHAMMTRRLDRTTPAASLLLAKPSFQIAHGGGKVLPEGSPEYRTMLEWVRQGASFDATGPIVERLEMFPAERTATPGSEPQRVAVMARLSDGSTRDMTREVRFDTSNESVVKLGEAGTWQPAGPGLATVLARAMGRATTAQIGVIGEPAAVVAPPSQNFIDDLVFAKLRRMNIRPAPLSSDDEFLRRVTIDAIGRIPTPGERRAFLDLPSADRRRLTVDTLLAHPEYIAYRTLRFEDWFRNTQLFSQGRPMGSFREWLKRQVETDRPYDETVRDLLTSQGDTVVNPAGGFWMPATDFMLNKFDPKAATPTVTRLFLGLRMECAECHNHPLENFTQDDFYGLAAFFARMRVKIGHGVYRRTWYLEDAAELEHPVTKKAVAPRVLASAPDRFAAREDRREKLAKWITAPANPYFARATVNRVWHASFGTGIVEPFDDFRSTNPPTNRELLDRLASYFIEKRFSLREMDRLIYNSATYQLSSRPAAEQSPELERLLFARYQPRRLPAEALLDSISQLTGVPQKFADHPPGTLAKDLEINDAPSHFLATFGFPRRDFLGTRHEAPTMSQALHLMNRATLKDKIEAEDNVIGRLLAAGTPEADLIGTLYERAYSRQMRDAERQLMARHLGEESAAGRPLRRTLENILLVLLNSKEFQLNH